MGEQLNPFDESHPEIPQPSYKITSIGSSVIPVVNRLQDIFAPFGGLSEIKLPQVAVVGSQSSGKSSVLEAIVGRDFLPRGSDICTRRPLVLQLENRSLKSENDDAREWGEFIHLPRKRFYDFAEIRREIQAETEREAGANRGVSDKQIRLKISSPNVLNITLVDLPGLTKVRVGDQPSDIEARIRTMIMSYIKHETCVILAVTPANADLANSDALQMARTADPAGLRTIGVMTKLDIMDRGTDACNFLLGKVIPLRLGYIGVINRSQQAINENRSVAEGLADEDEFFRSHPVYHSLSDSCGITQLAKKLNLILEQHIRKVLPGLKADLNSKMVAVVKELRSYGVVIESKDEQGALLLNILTRYCEAFCSLVDGKSQEMSTTELTGGARIHYIFQSIFVKRLEEVDPCDDLTDEDIRMAIQNATGPKIALFVPEVPFEVLIRRQIARLLDPSLQCLRFVYDELIKICHACEVIEMQRFPVLRRRLDEVMGKFLRDGVKPAERMIANLIEMEMDYINTSHPNFIGGSEAVESAAKQLRSLKEHMEVDKLTTFGKGPNSRPIVPVENGIMSDQGTRPPANGEKLGSTGNSSGRSWVSSIFGVGDSRTASGESSGRKPYSEPIHGINNTPSMIQLREPPAFLRPPEVRTEHEAVEIEVTKLLLRSYYNIARKNIEDFVPKAIMHFLVNHSKRDLLNTFIQKLYRENLFEEMLQEQEEVSTQRKRKRDLFQVLQQACQTLEEVESDVAAGSSSSSTDTATSLSRNPEVSLPLRSSEGEINSSNTSFLRNSRPRRLFNSGEQPSPQSSNGGFHTTGNAF
ncbi:hypothetical protein GIB67_014015 [Kingdonia uniflora]|uniref:Dynamin-related protein 3A-like n=1 Tax=Kingdonia uniflora TaxID=39325 RepID=A0A7J7L5I2_9MAGN|nr:hypothetical protein GIB67_014015 [Kingdonia uniflora]